MCHQSGNRPDTDTADGQRAGDDAPEDASAHESAGVECKQVETWEEWVREGERHE